MSGPHRGAVTDVLVLLSGGQDSTTCLAWAAHTYPGAKLHALTAYYAQRHESEVKAAVDIAQLLGCASHRIVDLTGALGRSDSALTDTSRELQADGGLRDAQAPTGLPTSFVPGRNLVFLAVAAAHAGAIGAKAIVTGVCQTDYSGYPDCRADFITAMQAAIDLALPTELAPIAVETPLMNRSKADTVTMMRNLAANEAFGRGGCGNWHQSKVWQALGLSVTCYRGQRPGCGTCPACLLRARGFHDAGIFDPANANAISEGDE